MRSCEARRGWNLDSRENGWREVGKKGGERERKEEEICLGFLFGIFGFGDLRVECGSVGIDGGSDFAPNLEWRQYRKREAE